eukprot:3156848-Amphidinium_carterae.1
MEDQAGAKLNDTPKRTDSGNSMNSPPLLQRHSWPWSKCKIGPQWQWLQGHCGLRSGWLLGELKFSNI